MIKKFYILVFIVLLAGCNDGESGSDAITPIKAWFPDLSSYTYSEEVFIGGDLSGYKGGKAIGNGSIEIYNSLTDQKIAAELLTQQECHEGGYVWLIFFIIYIDDYCSSDELFAAVVPVDIGINEITAEVLDNLGRVVQSKSYSVERLPKILLTFSNVIIEGVELDQAFSSNVTEYTANTCFKTDQINIKPILKLDFDAPYVPGHNLYTDYIRWESSSGAVTEDGVLDIHLNEGVNQFELRILYDFGNPDYDVFYNPDGFIIENAYKIEINRDYDTSAFLDSLVLSAGQLDGFFDPQILFYTATFGNEDEFVQIAATSADPCAEVSINQNIYENSQFSEQIALGEGPNLVTIGVHDGVTRKSYSIIGVRESTAEYLQTTYIKQYFNGAVEISGETIVAGTDYERVHIYTRDSQGEWSDMALVNTNSFSQGFGKSLALSNDTLIIGAPNKYTIVSVNPTRYMYDIGAAYIFIRDASNSWSEPQYIVAPTANEGNLFGSAVAAYGDVLAISAKGENGSRGAVYTYLNSNACFLCNRQHITASDFSDRNFGSSIALFGDTLAIGAPNDNAPGSVYVYVLDNTGMWTEQYVIKPPLNQDNDRFGHSVAIYDDTIVIGAPLEDSGSTGVNDDEQNNYENDAGAVYVYVRNNNIWTKQAYIKASNTNASDLFGNGVAVYQDTLLVGAPGEDSGSTGINSDQSNNSDIDAGAVYIYKRDSSNIWSQIEYVKASNTDPGDEFGWNVAIDNNISVINAKNEASARSGVNVEQADNSDFGRGALYLFE